MKKIICILVVICLIILKIIINNTNLIFSNEEEKRELMKVLDIEENTTSFQPIYYEIKRLELTSHEEMKTLIFKISKDDYEKNHLEYNEESNDSLIYEKSKVDKGNNYICKIKTSELLNSQKAEYEELNPHSQINEIINCVYNLFVVLVIVGCIIMYYRFQKRKN